MTSLRRTMKSWTLLRAKIGNDGTEVVPVAVFTKKPKTESLTEVCTNLDAEQLDELAHTYSCDAGEYLYELVEVPLIKVS